MPYSAQIRRENPSCILFLIDQSYSMSEPFAGSGAANKSQAVADAVNRLLNELSLKCTKGEGVRDYYHVGVIGYGGRVGPAFGGALSGRDLAPISEVVNHTLRIEDRVKKEPDGAGGILEISVKFPVWFDPVAQNGTPMAEAFAQARRILQDWLAGHPACYPPIVVNITDGEPDRKPLQEANEIMTLASSDGNALLYNVHISSLGLPPIMFADDPQALPDEHARLLYSLSSPLPPSTLKIARDSGHRLGDAARGFAFNADMVALISFLDIGTRKDLR